MNKNSHTNMLNINLTPVLKCYLVVLAPFTTADGFEEGQSVTRDGIYALAARFTI
jgi:hypothetical protein